MLLIELWHITFTGNLYDLYDAYHAQELCPIFTEKQVEEAREYMDKFLIRTNGLKAFL